MGIVVVRDLVCRWHFRIESFTYVSLGSWSCVLHHPSRQNRSPVTNRYTLDLCSASSPLIPLLHHGQGREYQQVAAVLSSTRRGRCRFTYTQRLCLRCVATVGDTFPRRGSRRSNCPLMYTIKPKCFGWFPHHAIQWRLVAKKEHNQTRWPTVGTRQWETEHYPTVNLVHDFNHIYRA